MKLILRTYIGSIDETNFCLKGSWIVTNLIESFFHFNEVLLHAGIWEYVVRVKRDA